jgi:hypothetical protein
MRAVLTGKSKTVSKVNDSFQQVSAFGAKFRIHDSHNSLEIQQTVAKQNHIDLPENVAYDMAGTNSGQHDSRIWSMEYTSDAPRDTDSLNAGKPSRIHNRAEFAANFLSDRMPGFYTPDVSTVNFPALFFGPHRCA